MTSTHKMCMGSPVILPLAGVYPKLLFDGVTRGAKVGLVIGDSFVCILGLQGAVELGLEVRHGPETVGLDCCMGRCRRSSRSAQDSPGSELPGAAAAITIQS